MENAQIIQKIEPDKATVMPRTNSDARGVPETQNTPASIKRGTSGTIQQNL